MAVKQRQVKRREEQFTTRTTTRIWQEVPSADNPYLAETCRCHGYDILELAAKRSFVDVLFLLFQGDLPNPDQTRLLEALLILLINPGPRHPATRAAMVAGVSRTLPVHLLPISLSILGGEAPAGAAEVTQAMHFLRKNSDKSPDHVVAELLAADPASNSSPKMHGFGSRFGGIDPFARHVAQHLLTVSPRAKTLIWGNELAERLDPHGQGWLLSGVAAAAFCDLGLHPRVGAGLFQLICAPGILAHGLELANKPITAMPFLDEEHYVIAPEAKKG